MIGTVLASILLLMFPLMIALRSYALLFTIRRQATPMPTFFRRPSQTVIAAASPGAYWSLVAMNASIIVILLVTYAYLFPSLLHMLGGGK
jgi:hypothetical protein